MHAAPDTQLVVPCASFHVAADAEQMMWSKIPSVQPAMQGWQQCHGFRFVVVGQQLTEECDVLGENAVGGVF
jgi:hypothetical protein